jgi:hypothetical protein
MSDNEDLYAAMYQDEDDAPVVAPGEKPVPDRGIMNMPQMSSEIRKLKQIIEDQERTIKRLVNSVKRLERQSNHIAGHINDLSHDLDGKMDRF